MRTAKLCTLPLNKDKRETIEGLCQAYAREKKVWLDVLRSWKFQAWLGCPRQIRDEFVKLGYQSAFGLQARHWKMALQDAAETWDKYWKALFVQVKSKIAQCNVLSDKGRHYAYFLLKGYSHFSALMQGQEPRAHFDIEKKELHKAACFVRKTIRKLKGKAPSVKQKKIIKFDADCYDSFEHEGRQYLKLMTLKKGQRLIIPLSGKVQIKGTLTCVLGDQDLKVHLAQELKPVNKKACTTVEAVDFGYTEVMTDTDGTRYGKDFGQHLNQASNVLHTKMQKRHKLHALGKKLGPTLSHKVKRLRKYNLGSKKLKESNRKTKARLEKEMNTAINQLIHKKNPAVLITEDLRHLFTYTQAKPVNRKLSSWLKGTLQNRVEFKALAKGFRHEQVNPAYGSQTCPCCEFVDQRNRKKDVFKCLHCGHEDIVDRVAAKNYAKRVGDEEIGRYVPYSQVKTTLLSRFHRRLETEQSVTVPGRTLDTAEDVYSHYLSKPKYKLQPGEATRQTGRSIKERNKINTF